MKKPLTKKQVQKLLADLSQWQANTTGTKISASYTFKSHIEALSFVARITVYAEVQQHHPDILYTYKKVKVTLTTHDAQGITQKDIDMATLISQLSDGG